MVYRVHLINLKLNAELATLQSMTECPMYKPRGDEQQCPRCEFLYNARYLTAFCDSFIFFCPRRKRHCCLTEINWYIITVTTHPACSGRIGQIISESHLARSADVARSSFGTRIGPFEELHSPHFAQCLANLTDSLHSAHYLAFSAVLILFIPHAISLL